MSTAGPGDPPDRLRGWGCTLLPFAVSLLLSAATVGNGPHWQDSALYLTAIREYSVLYPPGFTLYLTVCKGWTLLLGFVDFTLAVHLFSSLCAALAAAMLARAAREVTKDDLSAAVAATLAAAGYTWWFSGLYAKGYAFYFLMAATLLWRMTKRDHRGVALLSGLSMAAHPSAALLGPVVLLYIVRHRTELRALGAKQLGWMIPAALFCAFGPNLLLLPVLAARDSVVALGHPGTPGEVLQFVLGSSFTSMPGVWGFVGWRWAHAAQYAWEEFLGVGLLLAALGAVAWFRERREERWALLLWMLPVIVVSSLFKIEGQSDFWLVSAWMPLWVCAAVGLSTLRRRWAWAPQVALIAGLAWAVAANGRDLTLRNEGRPEALGRSMLQNLDPGATLVVSSDDAIGLCNYLQTIRGFRTDVRVVLLSMLQPSPKFAWYLDRVRRTWPEFTPPNYDLVLIHAAKYTNEALTQAAILQGRRPGAPPVFFDLEPPAPLIPSGAVVPAGFLWKWSEQPGERPDPRYWEVPMSLEEAASRRGRKRGIAVTYGPDNLWVRPQAYEERILYYLADARRKLGDLAQREGTKEGFERSARAYESIVRAAPDFGADPRIQYPLGLDYYMLNRPNEAAAAFTKALEADPSPTLKAGSLFYLGQLHEGSGRKPEALDHYRRALEVVPPESPLKPELERRLKP